MNWGHGVIAGFSLFVIYILYFVITSFTYDIDLVAPDYYAQEVAFQDRIEETSNANDVEKYIDVNQDDSSVKIIFQDSIAGTIDSGLVYFFRPSDLEADMRFKLELQIDNKMVFPTALFKPGRYEVHLSWKDSAKSYFLKKDIFI